MPSKLKLNHDYTSPNYSIRPDNTRIDTIVIHYTEMENELEAIQRLCNLESQVSAHYVISKTGEIFSLVPNEMRAWHAGISNWRGRSVVNDFSIGIELDNNGKEVFADELMDSLIVLCKQLIEEYNIPPYNIIGHSDIAPIRKQDPGIFFDWQKLAIHNIGLMPNDNLQIKMKEPSIISIQKHLAEFGYEIKPTDILDQEMVTILDAFAIHYLGRNFKTVDLSVIDAALVDLIKQIDSLG